MAYLQTSGPISLNDIDTVWFGQPLLNNLNSYRGAHWYKANGDSGTFSSGAISLSDFYGTGARPAYFNVDLLTVGGGGGAGGNVGGAGGGGGVGTGLITAYNGVNYAIVVGAGGAGGGINATGGGGFSSTFIGPAPIYLWGSGGNPGAPYYAGSEGGASGDSSTGPSYPGSAGGGDWYSGAGGGAGQAGQGNGGPGGNGYTWAINGLTYGGGGGGGNSDAPGQPGGAGGGGLGGGRFTGPYSTAGTNGLGGGGGGNSSIQNGQPGGSGTVLVTYVGTTPLATGGTITVSGGRVYHTFTSSGTFALVP